ncbi:hypothetical protein D5H75_38105 [Bailinhaonella thermotolerans]|uniref:Uncharacterized protein n=1 Tax=Bailinhaonella thermotolerans TaxID=1070861 RepID=A0A3A4A1A1_9ACTN|nr:hypothetical protein D5H75_38105 [Bailinhaonella thermotolerans]
MEFAATAAAQIPGLPELAFVAIVSALAGIRTNPWHGLPVYGAPPEYRMVTVSDTRGGEGLITYRVDQERALIHVFDITWLD